MSQHCEHHVDLFGEFCRRIRKCSAGTEQRLRFGASAIEKDQRVAVLLQIRRHTTPHYAQTDESNFHFHSFSHVAVTNSGSLTFFPSIVVISSSVRRSSAAPTFP